MSLSPTSIFLNYNYFYARAKCNDFEEGGVGGLIEKGYFQSIVLWQKGLTVFDRGHLYHYTERQEPCGPMTVYVRSPTFHEE